jgi:hypothetical protein
MLARRFDLCQECRNIAITAIASTPVASLTVANRPDILLVVLGANFVSSGRVARALKLLA